MSFWTIEQSTALLIGADPDVILDGGALALTCPSEMKTAYSRMFQLLDSHIRLSGIGSNLSPTEAIDWALHAKIDAPQALVEAVRAQGRTLVEARMEARANTEREELAQEKPLGERERNTLLRMIISMAIRGYGYDPDATRSDIPKTIASDLSDLGLECSDQTVREKLKEARDFLPGDWKARRDGKPN
jgi:hypothetical protein